MKWKQIYVIYFCDRQFYAFWLISFKGVIVTFGNEIFDEVVVVIVEFLGPIGIEPIQIEAKNLKELSEIIKVKAPEVQSWLASSAVAVNDKLVQSLDILLKDGDKVSLLPPVCGG
jgi:molybdopterin synthase sulfur carrier subunit